MTVIFKMTVTLDADKTAFMPRKLILQPIDPPLFIDSSGAVKIFNSRVTLDVIVRAFLRGATPEEIAQQFPTVSLPDIYTTITFYLKNRKGVDAYLEKRKIISESIKRENLARNSQKGLREKLLARKNYSSN